MTTTDTTTNVSRKVRRALRRRGLTDAEVELALAHTNRFRKVSNRYPLRVNEAYAFDQRRAMRDSDAQVAATVAAWERAEGLEPRDWHAIGAAERDDELDLEASWQRTISTADPEDRLTALIAWSAAH